jgi:hypothetical protein
VKQLLVQDDKSKDVRDDTTNEMNMTMTLESMAVEMPEVAGHPNRAGFRGVLTVVDVASQRAPSGSRGHRVVLTRSAAESALPSLLGMALDYAPSFDRHDQRRKVGVITSAEIMGRNLEVAGYLYAKDFPDVVEEIARFGSRSEEFNLSSPRALNARDPLTGLRATGDPQREVVEAGVELRRRWTDAAGLRSSLTTAVERIRELTEAVRKKSPRNRKDELQAAAERVGKAGLGMSYEVANVSLADTRARVWILTKVIFTGAAILRRDKAAYEDTWIALSPKS